MLGGDLRCSSISIIFPLSHIPHLCTVHLDRLGSLPEVTVRFYMAQLSSALCFLHEKHIMHRFAMPFLPVLIPFHLSLCHHSNRDIKPDNILLDERGHAHLTDFNIAVHFSERRLLTGVAGSMAYMAPEILQKRGYTYPIDWWSLGVCAFELILGADLSVAARTLHSPTAFPKTLCAFLGMLMRSVVALDFNLSGGCVAPVLPAPCLAQILFHLAHGQGSFQAHWM